MQSRLPAAIACLLSLPLSAAEPPPLDQRFAAIAPLVGHCWIAPIGADGLRDVQCYEWVYEKQFVRSTHRVLGGQGKAYQGTTMYAWDGRHQRLRYDYYASTGAVSEGHAEARGEDWLFSETHVDTSGREIHLRTTLTHDDPRHYSVATEMPEAADGPPKARTYTRGDAAGQALARVVHADREWLLTWASDRDGNWEIYREEADGNPRNLTRSASSEWPYGVSGQRLYLVSSARADEEARGWRLAALDDPAQPPERVHSRVVNDSLVSPHPDGARLAATVMIQSVPQIVLLDAAGEILETLSPAGVAESDPDFASDGRMLFRSKRSGSWELWVRGADGKTSKLTDDPANDQVDAHSYGGEGPGRWSPDGKRIAWQRSYPDRDNDIWVMQADGSGKINLTADHAGNDSYPAWSPDGRWIAFSSDRENDSEIWLIDADGRNPRRVSYSPGSDSQPMWVASGR